MNRMLMRRDPRLLGVIVVVVIAAAISWAQASEPGAVKRVVASARSAPITSQTLVCPQAGGTPSGGAARIAYADADPDPTAASASSLIVAPLDPDAVPSSIDLRGGHGWVVDGPKTVGPMRVTMSGPAAATSGAVQFTRQAVGGALQVSATPCEAPTTDAWFAGFASGVGAHATLLLSNIDTVPATVDVGIYADSAPPDPEADHGLVVAPQTQMAVRLDTLAPGFANAVAHVSVTSGRIVPAVRYDAENGSLPLGVEWIPRTDAPATDQILPGFVDGSGKRRLVIADTADVDATVSVQIVTADGSFTPTGFDAIDVPAGQVTNVDLDPALQGEAGAVEVTSTEPVVAGGVSALPLDKSGASDVGFTAAVPALSGPTVVAGGETGSDRHTKLLLSAPDDDAHLTVTVLPSAASSSPLVSPLTVPGGTTLTLDLAALSSDPAPAVEITPDAGGSLYAAWTLRETPSSTDLTSFPLRSPVTTLTRPPVATNPLAGLAGWPTAPAAGSARPAASQESAVPGVSGEPSDLLPSDSALPLGSPAQSPPSASSSQPSP
jgi:Family of unknown function (DUF5719)